MRIANIITLLFVIVGGINWGLSACSISILSPHCSAASQPFPFFGYFEPELAKAVRDGRRAEFAKFPEYPERIEPRKKTQRELNQGSPTDGREIGGTDRRPGLLAQTMLVEYFAVVLRMRSKALHNFTDGCCLLGRPYFLDLWRVSDGGGEHSKLQRSL